MKANCLLGGLYLLLAVAAGSAASATPVPAEEWTTDPASETFPVTGTAFDALEDGEAGMVSIVAVGVPSERPRIPVIVRNATDAPVSQVNVGAEARTAAGELIGASLSGRVQPFVLEPGALGMVSVSFSDPLPADAVITTYVDSTPGTAGADDWVGVTLTEYVPAVGGGIGTVENRSGFDLNTLYLEIACFDADGDLLAVEGVSASRASIPAGETSPFTVLGGPPDNDCGDFLFTGFGRMD